MRLLKKTPNIDFMGMSKFWGIVSTVVILSSILCVAFKGMKYGIDFAGGVETQVKFNDPSVNSQTVRQALEEAGFKDPSVVILGKDAKTPEFLVSILGEFKNANAMADSIKNAFVKKIGEGKAEIRRVDSVGPRAGKDLRKSGFYSILYCTLAILIYVWFRFDLKYAPGAIICLVHDVTIILGIFALMGKEYNLTILAAVLTIAGYSLNDTIVVFDRIRESIQKSGQGNLRSLINRSINETLSRTFLTGVSTLFCTLALYWKGGGAIQDFAFAMTIGVLVGTYSSIFVAAPVIPLMEKLMARGQQPKKRTA